MEGPRAGERDSDDAWARRGRSSIAHGVSGDNLRVGKVVNYNNGGGGLENFSYKMVKRPEFNKKKEHYQVKVEIEFSTHTPRYAREFHDILLAPNEIIDPTSDVKWSSERGRYRASFFLKDKTLYPNAKR